MSSECLHFEYLDPERVLPPAERARLRVARARAAAVVRSWRGPSTEVWSDRRRDDGIREAIGWLYSQVLGYRAARGGAPA